MSDLSAWQTGFRGRCPRCGEGALYDGFLKVGDHCPVCGLDYNFENAGDGAVPFLILLIGAVGVGVGVWVLFAFNAPVWVPILVSAPICTLLTVYLLPKAKGVLIALQYLNDASDTGTEPIDRD